jgi:hypothetical protein
MTCLEVRRVIMTSPLAVGAEVEAHVLDCPDCSRAFAEAVFLERKLKSAFDVEPRPHWNLDLINLPSHVPARGISRRAAVAGVAALAATLAAVTLGTDFMFPALRSEVMPHLKPYTLASIDLVGRDRLRSVLRSAGVTLVDDTIPAIYASNCAIRKSTAAHLVVKSDDGPVSVFLMPRVKVGDVEHFHDGTWTGRIEPFGQGSIALIALKVEGIEAADKMLRGAVSAG